MNRGVLSIFFICILTVHATICPDHICEQLTCDDVEGCEEKNGILRKKGGLCGCCDLCEIQLEENSICIPVDFHVTPSTEVCAEGLYCDHDTFTCKKKPN